MIGILGGMGTQAGLDFCSKLAKLYRGKLDQQYPMFILYNKSNTPKRPENLKKYYNVLDELVKGCKMLSKNKCKFIVMPCNTAHYWHQDIQKKIKIPLLSMPKEVFNYTKQNCKKNTKIGILCTEATLKTKVYHQYFDKKYDKSLEDLVHNRIYKPLGLKRTMYNPAKKIPTEEIVPSELDTYFRHDELRGYVHDMGAAMQSGIGGHAGLFSNASEVGVIMQMFLNKKLPVEDF